VWLLAYFRDAVLLSVLMGYATCMGAFRFTNHINDAKRARATVKTDDSTVHKHWALCTWHAGLDVQRRQRY
jgi:hypothetical protein